MSDTTRKVCSNCKHYMQHYMKHDFKLYPMPCGHCENKENYSGELKVCEFFKARSEKLTAAQRETQIKKLTESIEYTLKNLENLLLIVKDLEL